MTAVAFAQVQRMLHLFAQGIAGHFVALRQPSDETNQFALEVPAHIAYFSAPEHNQLAYCIVVLRELARREGPEAATWLRLLDRSPRPYLARFIFAWLERLRLDHCLRERYPGVHSGLDRLRIHDRARATAVSVRRRLPAVLESVRLACLGKESGLGREMEVLIGRVRRMGATRRDSTLAALALCRLLEARYGTGARARHALAWEDAVAAEFEDSDERSMVSAQQALPEDPPLPARQAEPEDDRDFEGITFMPGLADGTRRPVNEGTSAARGVTDAVAANAGGPLAAHSDTGQAPQAPPVSISRNPAPRSYLYDEWDFHHNRYLPAWCRVHEHRLSGDNLGFVTQVRRRHASLALQVRRQFALIRSAAWRRQRFTVDGDEIDLDGLIGSVLDRHTGAAGDARVYMRRDRVRRDVAAAFLVDMSASTDYQLVDQNPPPPPSDSSSAPEPYIHALRGEGSPAPRTPKRRVIDVAKEALALMCDALKMLGDDFAVWGFSGEGRGHVEFEIAKEFKDRLNARVWGALAAIEPRCSTRMGAAIRHATAKLGRESAAHKVLIVISDGYPEDRDYGPDRNDSEYGIQDTARALREAAQAGIVDFCVTIDPAGHDYLQRMCAARRYLVIDDIDALPGELTKIYSSLTV